MARYRCRRHNLRASSIIKILICYNKDTLHVSKSLEPVSVSVSPTLNCWIGNSLDHTIVDGMSLSVCIEDHFRYKNNQPTTCEDGISF